MKKQKIKEGSSGTPIQAFSGMKSEDRADLGRLYFELVDLIGQEDYDINFNQSSIVIRKRNQKAFDYTPYVTTLMEYMQKEGITLKPFPKITLNKDISESSNFFRSTAQYDPVESKITLFIGARHPKDVMRSLSHELIHHSQNLKGKLNNVQTSDTTQDDALAILEEEAYLKGNILFRKWEDTVKNQDGFKML